MNEVYIIVDDKDWVDVTNNVNNWIQYLKTKPKIQSLELCFRSHREKIEKSDAYYVGRGGYGVFPDYNDGGETVIIGVLTDGKLVKTSWKIPELTIVDVNEDDISNYLESEKLWVISPATVAVKT